MMNAADLNLTKGVEFWYSHYYNIFSCIGNDDAFCKFVENKFNTVSSKEHLCSTLHNIVLRHFSPELKEGELIVNECMVDNVEYKHEEKYIRFPDLKIKLLENFTFRIDINPCLAGKGRMTKIYCNAVYPESISRSDAISFLKNAKSACHDVVKVIAKMYFEFFNEYILKFDKSNTLEEVDLNKITPYELISCVVGSDDICSRSFIYNSKAPAVFKNAIITSNEQRNIASLLQEISQIVEPNWRLKEYKWETKEVRYRPNLLSPNQPNQVSGYLGFKGDNDRGVFIGLADATPRALLLPMHINIIQAN